MESVVNALIRGSISISNESMKHHRMQTTFEKMFRHRSSRTKSKGSNEGTSSSGLFQGTTQSRHRQEQLLGCLQAQAQEVPMAVQEAQQEAEQEAPQQEVEQEAPQQEAEQEAPQLGIGGETDPEAKTGIGSAIQSVRDRPKGHSSSLAENGNGNNHLQWDDATWDGTGHRCKVNALLGALCRYYYPGMVKVDGEWQAAMQWSHWSLKEYVRPDEGSSEGGSSEAPRRTCQSVVWDEFWLRYRLENEDDREVLRSVRRHFCRAAEKVIDDAFRNARISAVCQYYKRIKGENMTAKRGASQIYLTEQEYLQVSVDWIVKDVEAWRWLAKKWSTPEWIATSKLHRENRGTGGPGHRYKADGHYNLARRMEHQDGVAPSFMDVYIRGHRGSDPTNPEALCTEAAKEKMMAYGEEMTQRHGPDVDWRHAEVDPEALHASGGGRRHGRYAFGTGVVDYNPSVSRARRSGSSAGSSTSSSRTSRDAQVAEEVAAAREEARHHSSIGTRCELATLLPSSNVSAAGVDRVGATTPGLATTSGVDDGTPGLPTTFGMDNGTTGLPGTSGVDGTAGLSAISGVDGTAELSGRSSRVDGTARLSATSELDGTSRLPATFGVDDSRYTTLQPVDAITSSALWITGFGLTPFWPNSRS
ncbi:hypothetical protein U9M48_005031 [Paspalum notatum var. saurae]|uniref:Uncharacterized protein n=1 Tax=Paspalum notatum var. saurae TaxID=547442 RepID=A0AAQ3PKZ4_PASNO